MPGVSVIRWIFHDPKLNETWEVPYNPDAMTSPYPTRKFVYNSTTAGAGGGTSVANEAHPDPKEFQFSGQVLHRPHFDGLVYWSRKKNRITITDHFKRVLLVTLNDMDPVPKRAIGYYWRHTYTMNATCYAITDAPSNIGVPD